PLEQLHDQEGARSAQDTEIMDRYDVRMRKARRCPSLATEALGRFDASHSVLADHLHRDAPLEGEIDGGIDGSHPSRAETPVEEVALRDSTRQAHRCERRTFTGAVACAAVIADTAFGALHEAPGDFRTDRRSLEEKGQARSDRRQELLVLPGIRLL